MIPYVNGNMIRWKTEYEYEPDYPTFLAVTRALSQLPEIEVKKYEQSSIDGEFAANYLNGEIKMQYVAGYRPDEGMSAITCTAQNIDNVFAVVQNACEELKKSVIHLKYIGESFGVDGLTNGKIYDAYDEGDFYRVIDDSDEDYLYSKVNPAPGDSSSPGGKWEIVEE